MVRKVAAETPALLLDESDAAFKGDREYAEALQGILNAGFRRGGVASLCVQRGREIGYADFPVYCPKAIAGIGKLPDTVADRSVPIELRRRRPGEDVARFRVRKAEREGLSLRDAAAAWAEANIERLSGAEPELPDELDDRAQDIVEPLLAIADVVGGEWPERARSAVIALAGASAREDSESLGIRLLRDVKTVFNEEKAERLRTTTILTKLNKMDEAPWGSLRGEPLDARGLARLLKPYGVQPEQLRMDEEKVRGYRRGVFKDAWERYLSSTPKEAVQAVQAVHPADRAESDVPDTLRVPDNLRYPVHDNPHRNGDVPDVPDVPPDSGSSKGRCIHQVLGGCWLCKKYQPEVWGTA